MHAPLTLLALLPLAFAAPAVGKRAPVLSPREASVIPGKYIIKLKEGSSGATVDTVVEKLHKKHGKKAKHEYKGGSFKGFAAELDDAAIDTLTADSNVEYIEQDAVVQINAYTTQTGAPWGISRLSHKASGSTSYVYDTSAGAGVCAYVIDPGIYTAHAQFGGRATWLYNAAGDGSDRDGNGHGTHVAGTIGGSTYGVAKKVNLYAVKVLGASGSGTNSGVISGMNFVTTDVATRSCPNGTVANMSLGGSTSTAVNSAAAALVKAGVFLAVAAGNDNTNAANSSPASESTVCTVGATTSTDARASYSNYGAVVDIFAPGSSILSSWIGSTTATNTISAFAKPVPQEVFT